MQFFAKYRNRLFVLEDKNYSCYGIDNLLLFPRRRKAMELCDNCLLARWLWHGFYWSIDDVLSKVSYNKSRVGNTSSTLKIVNFGSRKSRYYICRESHKEFWFGIMIWDVCVF